MSVDMIDLDHGTTDDGCLAYAVYVTSGGHAEQTHGEHSDLVGSIIGDTLGDVEVFWVYSEERCAQDVCAYCKRWGGGDTCSGLWSHTLHAFARLSSRHTLDGLDLQVGMFRVPNDLPMGGLMANVLAQIRAGVRYAVAH